MKAYLEVLSCSLVTDATCPITWGDLCLTSDMCTSSCFTWFATMGISVQIWYQDELTRTHLWQTWSSHHPVPFCAYLIAQSFCGLNSVWERSLCSLTPYSIQYSSDLRSESVTQFLWLFCNKLVTHKASQRVDREIQHCPFLLFIDF